VSGRDVPAGVRRQHRLRLAVVGALAPALLALLCGVGYAYYATATSASGTGTATAAGTKVVTLSVTGTVSSGLYPGGSGASVTVSVTNPYGSPLTVSAVTAGTPVVTPVSGSTCANAALTVGQPASGLPYTVAAGATTSRTLTGVVTMGAAADNGCQGATVVVPLRVTGTV